MVDFEDAPTMTMSAVFEDVPDINIKERDVRNTRYNFFDKYEIAKDGFLGEGTFGKVYTVNIKDDYIEHVRKNDPEEYKSLPRYKGKIVKIYAAKVLVNNNINKRELALSTIISRYPHCANGIVCMYEAFTDVYDEESNTTKIVIVSEFIKGKSLEKYIEEKLSIEDRHLRWLMVECIRALQSVHNLGFAHRDIKPENIMHAYESIKIIDLGTCCRMVGDGSGRIEYPCVQNEYNGTIFYTAPEIQIAQQEGRSTTRFDMMKADNYSLGLSFKRLAGLSGNIFRYEGEGIERYGIMKDQSLVMDSIANLEYSNDIKKVIAGLNAYDPRERYSLEKCLYILGE